MNKIYKVLIGLACVIMLCLLFKDRHDKMILKNTQHDAFNKCMLNSDYTDIACDSCYVLTHQTQDRYYF